MSDDKYNYGDHRVQLSDTDSTLNSAQGLGDGYHLDIELAPKDKWPGTSPDPNKLRFNSDKMQDIATKVDALAALLDGNHNAPAQGGATTTGGGSGTPQSLVQNGSPAFGPPSWEAATFLQKATGQMANTIQGYSTTLGQNLRAARDAINTAAKNHGKSEDANAASGNQQVRGDTGTSGTSSGDATNWNQG